MLKKQGKAVPNDDLTTGKPAVGNIAAAQGKDDKPNKFNEEMKVNRTSLGA